VPPDEVLPAAEARGIEVFALDEELDALAQIDRRESRMVELRCFGGLKMAAQGIQGQPRRSPTRRGQGRRRQIEEKRLNGDNKMDRSGPVTALTARASCGILRPWRSAHYRRHCTGG